MADLLTVGAVRTSPLVSGSYVMRFGSVAVINTVVVFFFFGFQGLATVLILPSGHCELGLPCVFCAGMNPGGSSRRKNRRFRLGC